MLEYYGALQAVGAQKKPKQNIKQDLQKKPVEKANLYCRNPKWNFRQADKEKWSIFDFFTQSNANGKKTIESLRSFEGMTWREIVQASGGKASGHGTNSHYIPVDQLCRDAQKRLNDLRIQEDEIFSLRLTGTHRLWGIIEADGVFRILWYDPDHTIYPLDK